MDIRKESNRRLIANNKEKSKEITYSESEKFIGKNKQLQKHLQDIENKIDEIDVKALKRYLVSPVIFEDLKNKVREILKAI